MVDGFLALGSPSSFLPNTVYESGSTPDSGGDWQQVTHSHQVVGRGREGEGPTNPGDSTMTSLAQVGDVLANVRSIGVSVPPGNSAFTRIFCGPYSAASALVRPIMPALLAAYVPFAETPPYSPQTK